MTEVDLSEVGVGPAVTERTRERTDEAIVYDLDGTLVRLVVDWDAVAADVAARLEAAGVDAADADLWEMLDIAAEAGLSDEVEAVIAEHEHEGARNSERLPLADGLADADVPVAVCSLNCERACRIALDAHDLSEHVDAVVGRDSVSTRKPDPEPLLEAARLLSVDPADVVFIGDSKRDEVTAREAGTAFEYVRAYRRA